MNRRRVIFVMGLVLASSLAFAAPAFAAVTEIENPGDGNYLTETQKLDMSGLADFAPVSSLTQDGFTVGFVAEGKDPLFKLGWSFLSGINPAAVWGSDGQVEPPPRDFVNVWDFGPRSFELQLSSDVKEFGLEAGSSILTVGPRSDVVSVSFYKDAQLVRTLAKTISAETNDEVNARLFAISSDDAFNRVVITCDTGFPVISQIRYSADGPAPVVSTPASSPWSLAAAGLAALAMLAFPGFRDLGQRDLV